MSECLGCSNLSEVVIAAQARIDCLKQLLSESEERAAQWQADAEGYRIDAGVWRDRAEARAAAIRRALDVCADRGRRSLREPNAVSILAIREALAAAPEATAPDAGCSSAPHLNDNEWLRENLAAANARVGELEATATAVRPALLDAEAKLIAANARAEAAERKKDAYDQEAALQLNERHRAEAEAAALRAEVGHERKMRALQVSTINAAEAESAALRAEVDQLKGSLRGMTVSCGDAGDLIGEIFDSVEAAAQQGFSRLPEALEARLRAYRSTSTTAPTEREAAERKVLEACAALDQNWIERGYTGTTWERVAKAEIARRAVKP